jgi:hypothetical protein
MEQLSDSILMQLLCFWTLSIVLLLFKITHNVSEEKTGTSSIDWALLGRFHLKTETESSLRNVVCCFK